MRRAACLLALCPLATLPGLVSLAGCGGSDVSHGVRESGEEEREEGLKKVAAGRLSPRERSAYYLLSTTSGMLRAELEVVRSGRAADPATLRPGELAAAVAQLDQPKRIGRRLDSIRRQLRSIGRETLAGVDAAGATGLLGRLDRLNDRLRRVLRSDPAHAASVPD